MEASFVPQSNHGIMDEKEEDEELGSMSSFSSFSDDDDDDEGGLRGGSGNSIGSSSSDSTEDSIPSSSSSSLEGPLFEMSSLISQLPFKRGLSMHFEGKSQSFTSLSSVKNLEDLVKPKRPFRRKRVIKSSKSCYGWGLATTTTTSSSSRRRHNKKLLSPRGSSRTITKKNSTGTSRMQ